MADCSKAVLIVDDNAMVRAALRVFLEGSTRLRVCGEAADGTEAILKAKELRPGLILMDLSMPNMNGAEPRGLSERPCPKLESSSLLCTPTHLAKCWLQRLEWIWSCRKPKERLV